MRHKEVHIVNLLPAVKYVVEFARSRVSPKMKDRLTVSIISRNLEAPFDGQNMCGYRICTCFPETVCLEAATNCSRPARLVRI